MIGTYLALSAVLFVIGLAGVLLRRNPLAVLLSVEILLNAGNLALVTMARQTGTMDGQVFAIVVMAVAATEVVVGLGLVVAMYRRDLILDVDALRRLHGADLPGDTARLAVPPPRRAVGAARAESISR